MSAGLRARSGSALLSATLLPEEALLYEVRGRTPSAAGVRLPPAGSAHGLPSFLNFLFPSFLISLSGFFFVLHHVPTA